MHSHCFCSAIVKAINHSTTGDKNPSHIPQPYLSISAFKIYHLLQNLDTNYYRINWERNFRVLRKSNKSAFGFNNIYCFIAHDIVKQNCKFVI